MNDNSNIPSNSKAAVWFEQEVTHDNEDILLEEWTELISKYKGDEESVWFAFSEADNKRFRNFVIHLEQRLMNISQKII